MNIFITLDYELFMGKQTGTPMKCLIEPSNALAETCIDYNAKLIFFVDAAYILRLSILSKNNSQLRRDYHMVCDNIKSLCDQGHDIELHFHPQWLYSTYSNNVWEMDLCHYKLSDIPKAEVFEQFSKAKQTLDDVIQMSTIAFRAGGYSLNSFEEYAKLLKKNKIIIDSSVIGNKSVNSRFQSYNYINRPAKDSWQFEDDLSHEVIGGSITEYPISTSPDYISLIYLMKKRQNIKNLGINPIWGDGKGIGVHLRKSEIIQNYLKKLYGYMSFPASIDGSHSIILYDIYKYLFEKNANNMVIIGHPKNTSKKSIENLKKFLGVVSKNNRITTFRNLLDFHDHSIPFI